MKAFCLPAVRILSLVMGLLVLAFGLTGSITAATAAPVCATPDKDFAPFLVRFKNDASFQTARILFPLTVSVTEPASNGKMETTRHQVTLSELQSRPSRIIRGRAEAAMLKDSEGKLCEKGPQIHGDKATFLQYSCNTDVYADTYHFARQNGCWFLQSLENSGG